MPDPPRRVYAINEELVGPVRRKPPLLAAGALDGRLEVVVGAGQLDGRHELRPVFASEPPGQSYGPKTNLGPG